MIPGRWLDRVGSTGATRPVGAPKIPLGNYIVVELPPPMAAYAPQRLTKRGKYKTPARDIDRTKPEGRFCNEVDGSRLLGRTKPRVPPGLLRRKGRRALSRLGREMTRRTSVACCGLALPGRDVEVRARRGRPAVFVGLLRCRAVGVCPDCTVDMQFVRGKKLRRANAKNRELGGDMAMLTLTLPHGVGDDLRAIRRRVSTAWRYVQQGAPWQRFKKRFGVPRSVRALEVTHGERHGFHPHLHVAFHTSRTLEDAELAELERYMSERWRKAITSTRHGELWPEPHPKYGVRCSRLAGSDYLVKMGLDAQELVSSATKVGRESNRTPWQVLHAIQLARDAGDAERERYFSNVWQSYTRGMLGARHLTYSRGFFKSLGLEDDPPDDQLELDGCDGGEVVARIPAADFNKIRERPELLAALSYVSVLVKPGQWKEAVVRLVDAARGLPPVPF